MLQTPQRFPRAGSQAYPTPAATADADGTTTITFGPERPPGCPEGNWIQTVSGKGWFPILRLYSPTERFFHKRLIEKTWREVFEESWRPSEIELVTETTVTETTPSGDSTNGREHDGRAET